MNNDRLQREIGRLKSDFESVMDSLVYEIEELESKLEKSEFEKEGLCEEIENLKSREDA